MVSSAMEMPPAGRGAASLAAELPLPGGTELEYGHFGDPPGPGFPSARLAARDRAYPGEARPADRHRQCRAVVERLPRVVDDGEDRASAVECQPGLQFPRRRRAPRPQGHRPVALEAEDDRLALPDRYSGAGNGPR